MNELPQPPIKLFADYTSEERAKLRRSLQWIIDKLDSAANEIKGRTNG